MAKWDKTQLMERRLEGKLERRFMGLGGLFYEGRFVIHRNTRIDGGVCLGQGVREAIVVDSTKYPMINAVYRKLETMIKGKDTILSSVYTLVDKTLKYDEKFALKIDKKYPDKKVSLDLFIINRKGVCRHMALLCGVLLEKLQNSGIIRGKPSIDRNHIPMVGGHAWCRYTNSVGDVFILDVAQHFLGRLDKHEKNVKIDSYKIWEYYRPE